MINPLDPIMEWYQTAYDSMRLSKRVLRKGIKKVVKPGFVFAGKSHDENQRIVDVAVRELENVVVLAMVAAFERTLRDHFCEIVKRAIPAGPATHDAVRDGLIEDIEHWKFWEKLIAACRYVPAEDRGNLKNLVSFRNWWAHGRFLSEPQPYSAMPKAAYAQLTQFLVKAGII